MFNYSRWISMTPTKMRNDYRRDDDDYSYQKNSVLIYINRETDMYLTFILIITLISSRLLYAKEIPYAATY